MKPPERKRIARVLGIPKPQLRLCGRMLVATPIDRILRGVYMEDSSDPHRIYLWAFVQPLFVPSTTVVLSLGQRLGGASRTWSVDDAEDAASALVNEGVQFFGPISTPEALARWCLLDGRADEYALETKAYALVASGLFHEGARALRAFAASLPAAGPSWMSETRVRAEDLAQRAETDGESAQQLLREWELETREALRVSDIS